MNVKRFVCCLLASVLLLGVSLISCGNSSRAKAKNEIAPVSYTHLTLPTT